MKTVFMFPGQGAQEVGMGHALAARDEATRALFARAGDILGYDLAACCFDGPTDRLNATDVSQPAIFVTSVACLEALRDGRLDDSLAGLTPDACAGLSLGEYTALYAAGAMSFEDGLQLVQLRGRSMQAAAEQRAGGMVSVLGLDETQAENLCAAVRAEELAEPDGGPVVLAAVNFNCPGQIVLSGTTQAVARATALAEAHGASRAIPLQVVGGFHTEMMAPAAEALGAALAQCRFEVPRTPVVANVDAAYYGSVEEIRPKLMAQLVRPVRWQQSVERLLDEGAERFVEIGPGRVLTGLVKKITRARKQKVEILTMNGG